MMAKLYFENVPLIAANFVGLAEGTLGPKPGTPFYDGLTFHRVVPGFVVQGGDPLGTGEGGPGYSLPDQFDPALSHDSAGVLSMANEGPDTNGSQFFLTLGPTRRLDFLHSIFGRVVDHLEVLLRIRPGDVMEVKIHRVGEAASHFRTDRAELERLRDQVPRAVTSSEAPLYFADPDRLLPQDPPRARNFNFKLANVARTTGRRIFARVFASFSKVGDDDQPTVARKLAAQLGLDRQGLLAVYWAEQDNWEIVVGEEDAARWRQSSTVSLAECKLQLLAAAAQATAGWLATAEKAEEFSRNQLIKLKVDGVLQELIAAMIAKPGLAP